MFDAWQIALTAAVSFALGYLWPRIWRRLRFAWWDSRNYPTDF